MGAAPRDRQGIAAAVMATARNLGMALGVGLAGAIFTSVLASAAGGVGRPAEPAIFAATRASFLVAAALALVGVVYQRCVARQGQSRSENYRREREESR